MLQRARLPCTLEATLSHCSCLSLHIRNLARSVAQHQPISELAGLQAALSQEGVPILRSCGQHLQGLQQHRPTAPQGTTSAHQRTPQQLMQNPVKQQQIALGEAVLSPQQQQAPIELVKLSEDVRATRLKLHQKAASQKQPLPGSLASQLGKFSPGGYLRAHQACTGPSTHNMQRSPAGTKLNQLMMQWLPSHAWTTCSYRFLIIKDPRSLQWHSTENLHHTSVFHCAVPQTMRS